MSLLISGFMPSQTLIAVIYSFLPYSATCELHEFGQFLCIPVSKFVNWEYYYYYILLDGTVK